MTDAAAVRVLGMAIMAVWTPAAREDRVAVAAEVRDVLMRGVLDPARLDPTGLDPTGEVGRPR